MVKEIIRNNGEPCLNTKLNSSRILLHKGLPYSTDIVYFT